MQSKFKVSGKRLSRGDPEKRHLKWESAATALGLHHLRGSGLATLEFVKKMEVVACALKLKIPQTGMTSYG